MRPVRNLLFDFGNVLIDIDVAGTKAHMESFLRPEVRDEHGIEQLTQLVHSYETNKISTAEFADRIVLLSKPWIEASDIIEAWNGMLKGIPAHRLPMLKSLKEKYRVMMLSNTNALHIEWVHQYVFATYHIRDFESQFFHNVYYSHQIGYRKPSEEAFSVVIQDSNIDPTETLFIDDMEENIHAAEKLGFQSRLFSSHEEIVEVMGKMGFL